MRSSRDYKSKGDEGWGKGGKRDRDSWGDRKGDRDSYSWEKDSWGKGGKKGDRGKDSWSRRDSWGGDRDSWGGGRDSWGGGRDSWGGGKESRGGKDTWSSRDTWGGEGGKGDRGKGRKDKVKVSRETPTGKLEDLMVTDKAPIHFEVDKSVCGVVIGKGGRQVQETQRRSGAFVESAKNKDNDKRFIKIYGKQKAYALELICDHLDYMEVVEWGETPSLEFVVGEKTKAHVSAKDGHAMKQLKRNSGVKEILLADNILFVRGGWNEIADCGRLINELTSKKGDVNEEVNEFRALALQNAPGPGRTGKFKRPSNAPPVRPFKIPRMGSTIPIQVLVDKKVCGGLIGTAGKVVSKITETTGATIDIRDEHRNMGERTVTIKGDEDVKQAALSAILEKIEEATDAEMTEAYIVVPEDYVPSILGRKGEIIQKIQEESDTKIVVSRTDRGEIPGGVHIKGTRQGIYIVATNFDQLLNERHLELLEEDEEEEEE